MSDAAKEKQIQQAARTCRHFNGIQNRTCLAGVNYNSLGGTGAFPCTPVRLSEGRVVLTCDTFEATGETAARAEWAEMEIATALYLARLARGECPHCGQKAGRKQVGRCAYCAGCGARIGQTR